MQLDVTSGVQQTGGQGLEHGGAKFDNCGKSAGTSSGSALPNTECCSGGTTMSAHAAPTLRTSLPRPARCLTRPSLPQLPLPTSAATRPPARQTPLAHRLSTPAPLRPSTLRRLPHNVRYLPLD
ncbi:hypothetical protein OH77DRAFT_118326 [Trametes cingulata]|nr:hypothetical protein OH77DRAFT_118326 [Trametes cingulata]